MSTIQLPTIENTRKEILDFINNHPNSDMIDYNKNTNKTKLIDLINQLVESEANINTSEKVELPEVVVINEGEIEDVEITERKDLISKVFKTIGTHFSFKIKVQRDHNYEEFNKERLVEHILWWYLNKVKSMSFSEIKVIWNNSELRSQHVNDFLEIPIIKENIDLLFKGE